MTARHTSGDLDPCIISLEVFEGPLDLLLHMIRKHEIDIFDIPVSFITDMYLEYITSMQELQLDIAVEYLEMAATLAHIKSQMLLPEKPVEEEGEEKGPDPREELVRRLLEYKKYKEASRELSHKFMLGNHTFTGWAELPEPETRIVTDVTVFDLLDMASTLIEKAKQKGREGPQLIADRITIAERITQIVDMLKEKEKATFPSLFKEDYSVFDVVITFLALLEMVRLHMVSFVQDEIHGEITITQPVAYEKLEKEKEEAQETAAYKKEEGKEERSAEGSAPAAPEEEAARPEESPAEKQKEEQKTGQDPEADPGIAGELNDLLTDFLKDK